MGTALTGNTIASSYLGLIKSTDSLAISSTAKRITDGAGNDLPIKLTTTQMFFNNGSASAPALSFDGNSTEGFYIPTDENIGVTIAGTEVARFLSTGLSLTSSKLTLSNDQKIRWTSDDVYIQGTTSSDNIQLGVGGSTQFTFAQTTGVRLHQYGGGSITGTVTQRLGVTSTGQVVEIPIGAGALDGSGTAGKLAKFTDSDTLGDSILSESGTVITVGGTLTTTGQGIFTGFVAIGGTSPDESLHITNSSGANIILNSDANTADSGIYMSEGADATPTQNGAYLHYDASANEFKIATGGGSLTDRFTIARDTGDATFAGNLNIADTKKIIFGGTAGSGNDSASISFNDSTGILNVTASSGDSHKVQICGDTIEAEEGGTATFANGATIQSALSVDSISTIGSGTTMSLGTNAGNVMTLLNSNLGVNVTSPNRKLEVSSGGSDVPQIRASYDTSNYIDIKHDLINKVGGSSFTLQTGGSNALTLDTSQNATFAGNVTISQSNASSSDLINQNTHGTGTSRFIAQSNTTDQNAQLVSDDANNISWVMQELSTTS